MTGSGARREERREEWWPLIVVRVGGSCLLTQLQLRDAHYSVMPSFLLSVSRAGAKYGSGSSSSAHWFIHNAPFRV